MLKQRQEESDHELVQWCLAGEPDAWVELRRRHVQALARLIQRLLHHRTNARGHAEEMAEEVFESLLMPTQARLRRFQPARASFPTYLRLLALQAVHLDYRKNKRRAGLESELGGLEPAGAWDDDTVFALLLEEFVTSLPPRQQNYCRQELLGEPHPGRSLHVLRGAGI
jgi:DNA-directed RNA polymerase specialized sigma24 family protein